MSEITYNHLVSTAGVPKLNEKNFLPWRRQVTLVLRLRGLEKALTMQKIAYDEDQRIINDKAVLLLLETMDEEHRMLYHNEEWASDIMEALESSYADRSAANKHNLMSEFMSYKKKSTSSITEHIAHMKNLRVALIGLSQDISDEFFLMALINSISGEFPNIPEMWDTLHPSMKTLDFLIKQLKKKETSTKEEVDTQALIANRSAIPRTSIENRKKLTKCNRCGQRGHWYRDAVCPLKGGYNKTYTKPFVNTTTDTDGPVSTSPLNLALGDIDEKLHDKWVADSGATQHMCNQVKWMRSLKLFSPGQFCCVGDGSRIEIKGIGWVKLETTINGQKRYLNLGKVLYIPSLSTNLFSIGVSTTRGVNVYFERDKCIFKVGSERILEGQKISEQLFQLKVNTVIAPCEDKALVAMRSRTATEWHKALGHASDERVQKLLKDKELGLRIEREGTGESSSCPECPSGKAVHSSHPESTSNRSTTVGYRVHLDLAGPINKTSHSGYKYYLVSKDEASEYCFISFLADKTDVWAEVAKLFAKFEAESGYQVKSIQTDNGSEFINKKLELLCLREGVHHTRVAPYTPQQNAIVEREIGSIGRMARTILLSSKLPQKLWDEAVNTACYIRNRLPTKTSDLTPYERFIGRKPIIDNIVEFGTQVHILRNWAHQAKFDPRTEPGFVVGYTSRRNTYRVYIPNQERITESSDLYFRKHNNSPQIEKTQCGCKCDKIETVNVQVPSSVPKVSGMRAIYEPETHGLRRSYVLDDLREEMSTPEPPILKEHVPNIESPRAAELVDFSLRPLPPVPSEENVNQHPLKRLFFESQPRDQPDSNPTALMTQAGNWENDDNMPKSYFEALTGANKEEWRQGIEDELRAHEKNNTWSIITRPSDANLLSSKWVFTVKRNESGKITRYKARLVARGFDQQMGRDFFETYSPVAKIESIRTLIAIAASLNQEILQFDITTAFLNGKIEEDVYLEAPTGVKIRNDQCLKLNKALYGLKQAPRAWSSEFNRVMTEIGFKASRIDPCVYKHTKEVIYVAIYVDDGIVIGDELSKCKSVLHGLNQNFQVKEIELGTFIGFRINKVSSGITLDQKQYVLNLLRRQKFDNCYPVSSPMPETKSLFMGDKDERKVDPTRYKALIGALLYCATTTRPDILFPTIFLSRFNSDPKTRHLKAGQRILKYLKGTTDRCLYYPSGNQKLSIEAFTDSDFGGDISDRKSTSGGIIFVNSSAVIFYSRKQTITAQSTCEAEFIAANTITRELSWLTNFLQELEIRHQKPSLYIDNLPASSAIKNNEIRRGLKHIDIDLFYIREKFQNNAFDLKTVGSISQRADFLTKALPGDKLSQQLNACNIRCLNPSIDNKTRTSLLTTTSTEKYKMKRNKQRSKKGSQVSKTLIALLLSMLFVDHKVDTTKPYQNAESVLLVRTQRQVEIGIQYFDIELVYPSPCRIITLQGSNNLTALQTKILLDIEGQCQETYAQKFVEKLNLLTGCLRPSSEVIQIVKRVKRDFGITLAILLGTVIILGVKMISDMIISRWDPDSDHNKIKQLEERESKREAHIKDLKDALNLTLDGNDMSAAILKDIMSSLKKNTETLEELSQIVPNLAWISSRLYNTIMKDTEQITELIKECRLGRVNLDALRELGVTEPLDGFLTEDTVLENITLVDKSTFNLKFRARKRAMDTFIYMVEGFSMWKNITSLEPVLYKYDGPNYAIMNTTSNCIKGIQKPAGPIYESCIINDYHDHSLNKYVATNKSMDGDPDPPQVKKFGTASYVYCFLHKITIEDEDITCPNRVILIPMDRPFQIGNLSHTVSKTSLSVKTERKPIIPRGVIIRNDDEIDNQLIMLQAMRKLHQQSRSLIQEREGTLLNVKNELSVYNLGVVLGALSLLIAILKITYSCGAARDGGSSRHNETVVIQAPPPPPPNIIETVVNRDGHETKNSISKEQPRLYPVVPKAPPQDPAYVELS